MGQDPNQVLDVVKDRQEHDRAQRPNFGSDRRDIPRTGTCIVNRAWIVGNGSRCEVNILGNGHPTGVTVSDAYSPGMILTPGDVVQYQIKKHDQMLLTGTPISEITINNIINEGGSVEVFYPTQHFSIFNGGVRGTHAGS